MLYSESELLYFAYPTKKASRLTQKTVPNKTGLRIKTDLCTDANSAWHIKVQRQGRSSDLSLITFCTFPNFSIQWHVAKCSSLTATGSYRTFTCFPFHPVYPERITGHLIFLLFCYLLEFIMKPVKIQVFLFFPMQSVKFSLKLHI